MVTTTTEHQGRPQFEIPAGTKVDWTDTNGEIAKQLGCSTLTVMRLRKRLGKKPLPQGRPFEHAVVLPNNRLKASQETIATLQKAIANLAEILQVKK